MTTSTRQPPSRDLVTHELVGYLNALKIKTPRNGVKWTADGIRNARRNGQLIAKKLGRDYVFTPEAVEAWIAGGCQTGKAKEAGGGMKQKDVSGVIAAMCIKHQAMKLIEAEMDKYAIMSKEFNNLGAEWRKLAAELFEEFKGVAGANILYELLEHYTPPRQHRQRGNG